MADVLVTGQKTQVAVLPGVAGVVISRTHMGVAAQAAVIAPHHQNRFGVRFQTDNAIGHVHTHVFKPAGPTDVGLFVEPGFQFDHHGNLFAVARSIHQIIDNRGSGAGPVQGHLDRQDLRIAAGLTYETFDRRRKRFVRVMQQDRSVIANDVEYAARIAQGRVVDGAMHRIVQLRNIERGQFPQIFHADHDVGFGDVLAFVQTELGGQHTAVDRLDVFLGLQAHDRCEFTVAQFRLDHVQKIVGVFFVLLGVGVPRDTEQFAGFDGAVREKKVKVIGHDLFQGHKPVFVANPKKPRYTGPNRHFHPRHDRILFVLLMQGRQQVQ